MMLSLYSPASVGRLISDIEKFAHSEELMPDLLKDI